MLWGLPYPGGWARSPFPGAPLFEVAGRVGGAFRGLGSAGLAGGTAADVVVATCTSRAGSGAAPPCGLPGLAGMPQGGCPYGPRPDRSVMRVRGHVRVLNVYCY